MVPLLFVWLVAFRSIISIKNYARAINGSLDAKAINLIADGLLWSASYLIIATVLGSMVRWVIGTPYLQIAVLLRNHLPVIITLVGFSLLYAGSHRLRQIAHFKTWSFGTLWSFAAFAIFAGVFAIGFVTSPLTTDSSGAPLYALPKDTLLFTVVLPFLAAWLLGLMASINIAKYARFVKGTIYREMLRDLVRGILSVVGFGIIVQIISLMSRYIAQLNLAGVLVVIYAILVLYGLGFWFIYRGARRIMKLEVIE